MRFLAFRKIAFLAISAFFYSGVGYAQDGEININQDPKINKLLTYKKEINEEIGDDNRFRIQIFNGSLKNAKRAESKFKSKYTGIKTDTKFETPNYKVLVGNFRTSLEADKYLEKIQEHFPNAFKYNPKKKKKKS